MLDYKAGESVEEMNWRAIFHKNVRDKEGSPAGNIAGVTEDGNEIIITSQSGTLKYQIPKIYVANFNGAEVSLKLPRKHLDRFRV